MSWPPKKGIEELSTIPGLPEEGSRKGRGSFLDSLGQGAAGPGFVIPGRGCSPPGGRSLPGWRSGRIEVGGGSTPFLDEIGDLPHQEFNGKMGKSIGSIPRQTMERLKQ